MKNYAFKKAHRGRLAFRTPSRFIAKKIQAIKHFRMPARFPSRWEGHGKGKK